MQQGQYDSFGREGEETSSSVLELISSLFPLCVIKTTPSTGKPEHMQEVQTARETGLRVNVNP